MAKKEERSKEAKAKAASSGGKAKKKKWSKGKVKEKTNNAVLFDRATYDKLLKEIPQSKLITAAVVSERLRVGGSLARRALRDLEKKGLIVAVSKHHSLGIYTRPQAQAAPSK